MKRTLRALSVLMLLALMLTVLLVVGFAAEGDAGAADESTRLDKINAMGYNFPPEGDTEIPKYKVVYPDGTEYISYVATEMYDDSRSMPSGSTLVLLSDIYQSTSYITELRNPPDTDSMDVNVVADRRDDEVGFTADLEKTVNFDFAGHTIFSEFKQTFFSCKGAATLNVYSSEPGARLIALVEGKDTGGSVITLSSGNANIGDLLDENGEIVYPGENLSTYSAGGFVVSGGVLNVTGITAYRVATDYVSYFGISGNNAVANFTRARFFGVGRYLQIATREDGGKEGAIYGNVFTFQDCVISNIGSPSVVTGAFFRYMADDNEVYFNNTIFDTVSFTCDRYYEHEGIVDKFGNPLRENKTAVVAFDKYCSYNQLPDVNSIIDKAENSSKFAIFKFPELPEGYGVRGSGVPEYLLSDGLITDVSAIVFDAEYKAANGIHDYRMHNLLEDYDLAGMYTLPYVGYEDDVVEITWEYQGVTSEPELWIKGENPTPYTIDVPRDTRHIQYNTNKVYEQDGIAFYTVSPKVNVSLKMNFTFSDKVYINAYIPVYDDLAIDEFVYRLSIAGVVTKIADIKENSELVELDGQQYYKVVSPVEYARITDKLVVTVDVANRSKTGKSFTITKRVGFTELMATYLDSGETDAFKEAVGDVLYCIYQNSSNLAAAPELDALVNERFAARIEEDKRLAEEAAKANESGGIAAIIDKITGLFAK